MIVEAFRRGKPNPCPLGNGLDASQPVERLGQIQATEQRVIDNVDRVVK